MGGKSAPTIWGRFAACIGRILATTSPPDTTRIEVYVDDPLFATFGTVHQRTRHLTRALLTLDLLGFPLAWAKATIGPRVVWIGAQFASLPQDIRLTIPDVRIDDLTTDTHRFQQTHITHRRSMRSYCGKLSFIAGIIPIVRPFLAMFWATIFAPSNLPPALMHTRRCSHALAWIRLLLTHLREHLHRTFPLHTPLVPEGNYIATDACPWGIGGVLFRDYLPIAWFASPLGPDDLRRFNAVKGDPAHNTTWEALALLVAFRTWRPDAATLGRVRSDSLSALRALTKLSSKSPALNGIAREVALDIATDLYTWRVSTHIPGITNLLPDDLSRMWAPDPHDFPSALLHVPESPTATRDASVWRTATPAHRAGKAHRR